MSRWKKILIAASLVIAVLIVALYAFLALYDFNKFKPIIAQAVKRESPDLNKLVGGKLNPAWVEWLMGWPLGWTDLKPLAMDKYLKWCEQHGMS